MPDLCKHCKAELPISHDGPCPECGGTGKNAILNAQSGVLSISGTTAKLTRIREYYEKKPLALGALIMIGVGAPILGHYVAGLPGVIVGLLFSALSFSIGLRAITRVKEINRG